MFISLSSANLLPERIIHCWGIAKEAEHEDDKDGLALDTIFFYSLFKTIKVAHQHMHAVKEITVLTNDLHSVFEQDRVSSSIKSLTIALLKVIGQEYPAITTGHIDISLSENINESYIANLFAEIRYSQSGKIVSFRNSCRWIQVYDKLNRENIASKTVNFKRKGVYLITGGLGDFGFIMSKYLGKHFKAKLILLGRERLPAQGEWSSYLDDENSIKTIKDKIRRILAIKKTGGEVLYSNCDISSRKRFAQVVKISVEKFGEIDGVFHAAGIVDSQTLKTLDELDIKDFESQFSPKKNGLIVLQEVLREKKIDFCFVTSSISSVLGGLGFAAYAAANIFMDYYIKTQREKGSLKNWISVNMDGFGVKSNIIVSEELPDVVNHALSLKELPQILVSTTDFQQRLDNWVSKSNVDNYDEEIVDLSEEIIDSNDILEEGLSSTEKSLVKLWGNFFGRTDIRVDTDFFELGGDSLKAITLIKRIQKKFGVLIGVSVFFSKPNIKKLAQEIDLTLNGINIQTKKKATNVIKI